MEFLPSLRQHKHALRVSVYRGDDSWGCYQERDGTREREKNQNRRGPTEKDGEGEKRNATMSGRADGESGLGGV